MARFLDIRRILGLTQTEMAAALNCSQSNVSFLDRGQTITPDLARQLIDAAAALGVSLTFEHVYGTAQLPPPRRPLNSRFLTPHDWPRIGAELASRGWSLTALSGRFGVRVTTLAALFHGELDDPAHALGEALLELHASNAAPVAARGVTAKAA